jgi:hypothetical protein
MTSTDGGDVTRAELVEEAERIAALTCRELELVVAEVEALDREGRRVVLIDWLTGRVERDQ